MVTPSAVKTARAESQDHKMLWSAHDIALWEQAHHVQCHGTTVPKVVRGEVIPGRRCKNTIVWPEAWLLLPELSPPPVSLCWMHTGQRRDLMARFAG
jgi:hypothetical protein